MSNGQQKKVWVSKYALTQGIHEMLVEVSIDFPTMCTAVSNSLQNFHKPYWSDIKEEAIAQAEKMRKAKIVSVKKQLKKFEEMTF